MTRVHRPFLLTCALASCLLLIGISSAYAGQVFIHTPANGTVVLDVQPSETIAQVEADIQTRIGVDPSVQILTFAGHALDPIQNLSYQNFVSLLIQIVFADKFLFGKLNFSKKIIFY